MTTGSPREVMRKRQKRRRDFSALAPLLQTPSDFTSSITLTANAKLWVAFDHIETAQLVLDINAREIGVPDLAAFERHCIGWFEKGSTIAVKGGVTGDMYLYADAGIGGLKLIGTSGGGLTPDLYIPLTTDLSTAIGTAVASISRATLGTVFDQEGILNTAQWGEIRPVGARRVENLFSWGAGAATQNAFAGADWTRTLVTVFDGQGPDPFGGNEASSVSSTGGNWLLFHGSSDEEYVLGEYVISCWVKRNTGTDQTFKLMLDGTDLSPDFTATDTWQRFSYKGITGIGQSQDGIVRNAAFGAAELLVYGMQLELVAGQANQNPSEYVSFGVESAPFHGAGVDGVQYFGTANGNTVDGNGVVTEATGAALTTMEGILIEKAATNYMPNSRDLLEAEWGEVGPTGRTQDVVGIDGVDNAAWSASDNDAGGYAFFRQVSIFLISAADTSPYAFSCYLKKEAVLDGVDHIYFGNSTSGKHEYISVNSVSGAIDRHSPLGGGFDAIGIEDSSDDWWRPHAISTKLNNSQTVNVSPFPAGAITSMTGLNVAGVGASRYDYFQVEQSEYPTSPIVTGATITTRDAEFLTVDSPLPSANDIAFAFDWTCKTPADVRVFFWGSRVDVDNLTTVLYDANEIVFEKRIGGVKHQAKVSLTPVIGTTYRIRLRALEIGGTDVWLDTTKGANAANTGGLPLTTITELGRLNSINHTALALKEYKVYDRILTDAEMLQT